MQEHLKDKVAIITGAAGGIGSATAQRFVEEGAKVVLADFDLEGAQKVATELGDNAVAVQVDVSDKDSVVAMVQTAAEKFGTVHILINNAGIARDAFCKKMSVEQWDQVVNVNMKGTFLCCQAVIPIFAENKGGKIVNTASIGALGNMGQTNYSASKAGIIGMTKTLALELARDGVNVNCVSPGATDTQLFDGVPEEIKDGIKSKIPFRRFAQPIDIANLHAFLVSDGAAYITGQTIFCDGGISVGI